MAGTNHDITGLLRRIADGDRVAGEELLPLVYAELRDLARGQFRVTAGAVETLQPTALVHEVYLKLLGVSPPAFADREHFLAVAATAMRSILVDHARARRAAKRGGNRERVPLDAVLMPFEAQVMDVLALDDALERLARVSQQAARVVELRFFGGLEQTETARVLGVSVSTIERDWRAARAWLRRELESRDAEGSG